ncbi:MAG: T9SS type A sorting domain-containing protein [Saprospiraceae bacterium]
MLKQVLFRSLLLFAFFSNAPCLLAQLPTPINYGQSIVGNLPLTSSTASYTTPFAQPGDVLLVRAVPAGLMALKLELFSPSGQFLMEYFPLANTDYIHFFYTIPPAPAGESGIYKMIVSNTDGFFTGNFCLFLQRANDPPNAQFLNCNSSLNDDMDCESSILSLQYMVQQGAVSRITINPNGLATPEAWLCSSDGTILRYGVSASGSALTFDTIPAAYTGCYHVFLTGFDAFFTSGFNISHTLLSGNCAAPLVQVMPSNGNVCTGSPFSLSVSSPLPNASFLWSGPNGFTSSQTEISFPEAADSLAGVYTVTVTTPGVCSSVLTRTISVKPLPTALASVTPVSGSVCAGQSFSLNVTTNASGPISYKWNGPSNYSSTQKSPTLNNSTPAQSGFYAISVTDGNGCVGTGGIQVSVNALPSSTITSPPNGKVCLGQILQLNVDTDAQDPIFSWSGPVFCGFTSTLQNPQIPNVGFECGGNYFVTVTDVATGCSSTTSKFVTVNSLPLADISGGTLPLCAGTSTDLTGCCSAQAYAWSTGETTSSITVTPLTTTKYYLTITNANGCMNSDSTVVQVNPRPTVSAMSTPEVPEICSDEGQILLCATSSDATKPSWKWTTTGFNSTQQCIVLTTPQQSGVYTAAVTDGITGCSNTATPINVSIHAKPTVNILQIPTPPYCAGDDLTFCANSDATGPSFVWTGPNGFLGTTLCVTVNDAGVLESGVYSVIVTDVFGCVANTAAVNILINPQPTAAIAGGLAICKGSTTVLTASGGGTYSWSIVSSGASITVAPAATTTYSVTVTNNFGCTDTASATVEVSANDLVLSVVSQNGDIQASTSGGQQPYTYSIFPFVPQSPNQPGLFENAPSGTYTVTVMDNFGCTASNVIVGTVEPAEAWGLTVAPNPSGGIVQIWTGKPLTEKLEIALFDATGRRIRDFQMETPALTLDLTDLPTGFYALRISEGQKVGAVRLAVVR